MVILHRNLISIAAVLTVQSFAMNLINIFVPLLMLKQEASIAQICLFYLCYAFCKLAVNYPSVRLINKYGARAGLMTALAFSVCYLILLHGYVNGLGQYLVHCASVAFAVMNSFLWNSQHIHISRVFEPYRKSRDLAMMNLLNRISTVLAPLTGGLLLFFGGRNLLLSVAIGLIALAAIPMRSMDTLAGGHREQAHIAYSLRHAPWRDLVGNFSFNTNTLIHWLVWPIYLGVVVGSFTSIGVISTVAEVFTFLVLLAAGKRGDSRGNHRVLLEGTALSSALHTARAFGVGPIAAAGITVASRTLAGYQKIPWDSIYYGHARAGGVNYIMSMEIAGDIAYVLMWSVLLAAALLAATPATFFLVIFLGAAVINWGCLLISRESAVPDGELVPRKP